MNISKQKYLTCVFALLAFSGCVSTTNNLNARQGGIGIVQNYDAIQYLLTGKKQYLAGDLEMAELSLKRSVSISKSVTDAHLYLGNIYFRQERFSKSQEQFEKALKIDSNNVLARYNLMLITLRETDKQLAALSNILQENKTPSPKISDFRAAISQFTGSDEKIIKVNRQHDDAKKIDDLIVQY